MIKINGLCFLPCVSLIRNAVPRFHLEGNKGRVCVFYLNQLMTRPVRRDALQLAVVSQQTQCMAIKHVQTKHLCPTVTQSVCRPRRVTVTVCKYQFLFVPDM